MTLPLSESLISLADAAKLLPPGWKGKPLSFSTVYRWGLRGVLAADGTRVKLETCRLGGRYMTSREALERFIAALTPASEAAPPPVRSPSSRTRTAAAAGEALEKVWG